jgi:hypothetical protein
MARSSNRFRVDAAVWEKWTHDKLYQTGDVGGRRRRTGMDLYIAVHSTFEINNRFAINERDKRR